MNEIYFYFTNPVDGSVWAYDESQVAAGAGANMIPLVGDELEAFLHPVPTQAEIIAANEGERTLRADEASRAMAPILVSLQLGDATDDETLRAKAWQSYYRALQTVDVAITTPAWPEKPAA